MIAREKDGPCSLLLYTQLFGGSALQCVKKRFSWDPLNEFKVTESPRSCTVLGFIQHGQGDTVRRPPHQSDSKSVSPHVHLLCSVLFNTAKEIQSVDLVRIKRLRGLGCPKGHETESSALD